MPMLIDGELMLYGVVGVSFDWWSGERIGFTSLDVIAALAR